MNSDAAAAFKSATYQGNYADLNFWITMLQGGVLGCASVGCHMCTLLHWPSACGATYCRAADRDGDSGLLPQGHHAPLVRGQRPR